MLIVSIFVVLKKEDDKNNIEKIKSSHSEVTSSTEKSLRCQLFSNLIATEAHNSLNSFETTSLLVIFEISFTPKFFFLLIHLIVTCSNLQIQEIFIGFQRDRLEIVAIIVQKKLCSANSCCRGNTTRHPMIGRCQLSSSVSNEQYA